MINAAITDGDWVAVRQQPVAGNGEPTPADDATILGVVVAVLRRL